MSGVVGGAWSLIALVADLVAAGAPLPVLLGIAGLAGLTAGAAVVALRLAVRVGASSGRTADPAPTREADASLPWPIAQSDPDAAGHVRSRAPGRASRSPLLVPRPL